ncbi:hypothetical protein [Pantoea stewartii]|uniref:Uncharacterized protein n=1 Tax=Pantoea stewartii subsp. stewartii DC283 TaxID=660596 RepID=H3RBI6_PANSE|nr:hypothetical protein [Pantoea stewartii]ARF49630.1 hypothetical protein DSJ_09940 [Pantoea stewartii subsp. stewartii DC283]EHU01325.1 hypothetical protein CKS_4075 [Pantoea stewartii subsp. stewartii DC283]KAB0559993.1 hypothetical protein F7Q90_00960 [Pantoea stewartii subsp. stewartii]
MSINIDELNEAYTLSKSLNVIIKKMMDSLPPDQDDNSAAFYGLSHICESVTDNQGKAIQKLLKIDNN